MKIYGEIHRKAVPTETVTREVYYIFENTTKETVKNNRKLRKQQRRTDRAIIFVGILIASGIWTLYKKSKGDTNEKI